MKAISRFGAFTKTAISYGNMIDYGSDIPTYIKDSQEHSYIKTDYGLFTIFPVMGLGWINAVGLSKKDRGPFLLLDNIFQETLDKSKLCLVERHDCNYICINWVTTRNELISEIFNKINMVEPSPNEIKQSLRDYIEMYDNKEDDRWKEWKMNAGLLINSN